MIVGNGRDKGSIVGTGEIPCTLLTVLEFCFENPLSALIFFALVCPDSMFCLREEKLKYYYKDR